MPQPVIYVALSNHGYGHATRTASIVALVAQRCPDLRIIVAGTAPRWLLDAYVEAPFELRPVQLDVGVAQSDSLTIDRDATLRKLRTLRTRQHDLIIEELRFVRQAGVRIVLGDIPPFAAVLADAARVPCWMVSNFGWDYIYSAWGGPFDEIARWVEDCYGLCDRLYRLPFHEPMSSFMDIVDVGLTGGTPHGEPEELRRRLGLTAPRERTGLLTFGGLGITNLPYEGLARHPDWQLITHDQKAPGLPNLINIAGTGLRPVDVMPLCGRVIGKPGYSTFSEACRQDVAIVTMPRDDFAEAGVLNAGIRNHAHHQVITPDDLFRGDWSFLDVPPDPPQSPAPLGRDGTETVAGKIAHYLGHQTATQ